MLNKCKILPIHAEVGARGKRTPLNHHLQRNHSLHSARAPLAYT